MEVKTSPLVLTQPKLGYFPNIHPLMNYFVMNWQKSNHRPSNPEKVTRFP